MVLHYGLAAARRLSRVNRVGLQNPKQTKQAFNNRLNDCISHTPACFHRNAPIDLVEHHLLWFFPNLPATGSRWLYNQTGLKNLLGHHQPAKKLSAIIAAEQLIMQELVLVVKLYQGAYQQKSAVAYHHLLSTLLETIPDIADQQVQCIALTVGCMPVSTTMNLL